MFNVRLVALLFISYVVIPRLTFLPPTLQSLLTIFGPFLLPRVFDWIDIARGTSRGVAVRPTPPRVQIALNLLFTSAVVCFVLSFSQFAPENIFLKTQSHIRTETSVLFARLRHLRPLTEIDQTLRIKFTTNARNKLFYLAYGPDTLLNCVWCVSANENDGHNHLIYSLPQMIRPHILQIAVLGIATSSLIGTECSRFRIHAMITGILLLVTETWYMSTYDITVNKRAKSVEDLDSAFWRVRFLRYMSFALVDIALAAILWTTSTNRWLAKPASIAERIEMSSRQAQEALNKMRALGLLSNSINRDQSLRNEREQYWRTEGLFMTEVMQEEAVMEQLNAVVTKMNFTNLNHRVGQVADSIVMGIDSLKQPDKPPLPSTEDESTMMES